MAGFLRRAPADRHGPPTIISSKRRVKAENMTNIIKEYQAVSDIYKANEHGVLSFTAAPDPNDATLLHDLRIFADDAAFISHAESMKEGEAKITALIDWDAHEVIRGIAWSNETEILEIRTKEQNYNLDIYNINEIEGGVTLAIGESLEWHGLEE